MKREVRHNEVSSNIYNSISLEEKMITSDLQLRAAYPPELTVDRVHLSDQMN